VSGGKQEASDASFEDDRKDIVERARKARDRHLRFAAYRTHSTLQGFGCGGNFSQKLSRVDEP
jgi:hypothetical protein